MLELDLTNVESKEFSNFPVGKTKCWVNKVVKKAPQGQGNPFLEVKLTDGTALLTDRIYLTDKAKWRVQQFLKACQLPHEGKVSLDESDIENRHIIVDCFAEAYKKQDGTDGTAIRVKSYNIDPKFSYPAVTPAVAPAEQDVPSEDIPY